MLEQSEGVMTKGESSVALAAALKCELATEVLRSFGVLRFAATGWSMLPAVWPGDTLVVEPIGGDQVRVGDIVLVNRHARLCAHRVVSAPVRGEARRWITQGDGNPAPDPPLLENELLGRVTYLIRAGRLLPAPAKLSAMERLLARAVRRSDPAARVLVYLNSRRQTSSPGGLLKNSKISARPWKRGPSEPALSLSKGPRKSLEINMGFSPRGRPDRAGIFS